MEDHKKEAFNQRELENLSATQTKFVHSVADKIQNLCLR